MVSRTGRIATLALLAALLGAAPATAAPGRATAALAPAAIVSVPQVVAEPTRVGTATATNGQPNPVLLAEGTPTTTGTPQPPELIPQTITMPDGKVVIGVVAVVLFVIVFYGRKIRKARKKNGGGGA